MTTISVDIEQRHIDEANRLLCDASKARCRNCPFALALLEVIQLFPGERLDVRGLGNVEILNEAPMLIEAWSPGPGVLSAIFKYDNSSVMPLGRYEFHQTYRRENGPTRILHVGRAVGTTQAQD